MKEQAEKKKVQTKGKSPQKKKVVVSRGNGGGEGDPKVIDPGSGKP